MTRLLFCLAIACGTLFGQHSFTVIDVEDGGRLYRANCTICHGAEGNGVSGIDLAHNKFRRAKDDDDIAAIIRTGIASTAMAPNNFSDFQALTIVAYLRSIAAATDATTSGHAARRFTTAKVTVSVATAFAALDPARARISARSAICGSLVNWNARSLRPMPMCLHNTDTSGE
jgi:hypothetical protein